MVAATAVTPSSSGTPAATSEPNATMRMMSVIGSEDLGLLEVLLERLRDRLVGARVTELADEHLRVGLLRCGGGGQCAVDALLGDLVIARDLERHERRAAVLGQPPVALGERDSTLSTPLVASSRETVSSTAAVKAGSPIFTEPLP